MRVYIIGFMGSGKSSAGKRLASKLGCRFVDLDAYIEEKEMKTVSQLFEQGEEHFRQLEKKYLAETSAIEDAVIALGGGAPCTEENMRFIKENGLSVYFYASPSLLFQRLKNAKETRPLLAGKDDRELLYYIEEKLAEREAYYAQADVVSSAVSIDVDQLAAIISGTLYLRRG